jgi:hypothetical protein
MGLFSSSGLNATPSTSQQQTVSPYAQPYVSDMLSKAQALTDTAMPAYQGQLTAGPSELQNQAWSGLSGLTLPASLQNAGNNLNDISNKEQALTYTPNTITANEFNKTAAEQYMNPYIQQALDPQLAALQRQQQINQLGDMAKLTQAGAYGGSRQAILQGQNNYNLLAQQAGLIGSGYNQAYNQAAQQFNADQARNMQAQQLNQSGNQFAATYGLQGLQAATQAQTAAANAGAQGAQYGLANLQAQSKAGADQQALSQQALNAQYNEYLRQLKYPQDMLNLQKNIINGLPATTTNTYSAKQSLAQSAAGGISGVAGMVKDLKAAGMSIPAISKYINGLTKSDPTSTGGVTIDANGNYVYPTGPGGQSPYDDQGNLMPGFGYDENNNPVWVSSDYREPASANTTTPSNVIGDDPTTVNNYWDSQTIDTNSDSNPP